MSQAIIFLALTASSLPAAQPDAPAAKVAEIAGTAELLRAVPKQFATLQAVDADARRVTLLIEGERLPKVWPLVPDAEVKVGGWWGRLDQLTPGDRVWVWFQTDRKKLPTAVLMLADELSEQAIHGARWTVAERAGDRVTLHPARGEDRTLAVAAGAVVPGKGVEVSWQSAGGTARLLLDPTAFSRRQAYQRAQLRERWSKEGLPGTVTFLHRLSSEMEVMLDHEAMRWGRSLQPGDTVTIPGKPDIPAVVKRVAPWRERTLVRLVTNADDQADLAVGQRVAVRRKPPPESVDADPLPPDVDRPRSKEERVEWVLASVYCTCKVRGDICTGHFYTLASCNPNGCGAPNQMRKKLAGMIDRDLTDREILEGLLKERGPELLHPHLLP
jgi:hypothetical protein